MKVERKLDYIQEKLRNRLDWQTSPGQIYLDAPTFERGGNAKRASPSPSLHLHQIAKKKNGKELNTFPQNPTMAKESTRPGIMET
jgi:hypothetical protein